MKKNILTATFMVVMLFTAQSQIWYEVINQSSYSIGCSIGGENPGVIPANVALDGYLPNKQLPLEWKAGFLGCAVQGVFENKTNPVTLEVCDLMKVTYSVKFIGVDEYFIQLWFVDQ